MIGILCALPRELSPLIKRKPDGCRILAAGMGAEAARKGAQALIDAGPLSALISAGYAGGLAAPATPGTIVVDTADADLDRCLPHALRGRIAGAAAMVRTAAERRRLAAATGAIAVDMESETVAGVAKLHSIPFAAVRAITDGPDADLVMQWDRYHNPGAAVLAALRTPGGIAEMRQLWYASREATRALCGFLSDFLRLWETR